MRLKAFKTEWGHTHFIRLFLFPLIKSPEMLTLGPWFTSITHLTIMDISPELTLIVGMDPMPPPPHHSSRHRIKSLMTFRRFLHNLSMHGEHNSVSDSWLESQNWHQLSPVTRALLLVFDTVCPTSVHGFTVHNFSYL